LVANQPVRTATVTALEPTKTLTLRQQQLGKFRRNHPHRPDSSSPSRPSRSSALSRQLFEVLFVDAETRVLRRLLDLARMR
jgi:hypothetical protein